MVEPVLVVEGVSKGYSRDGRWSGVLSDVSLQVGPGEIAAVLGRRLAGKSTLLQIAAGMQRPDEGRVLLENVDLTGLSDRRRSRLLGRDVVWLDRNGPGLNVEVRRFVGLSLVLHGHGRRETRRVATEMLGRVGARECVGQHWGELSNWRQLLVGLARGFAGSPRLVVIDDLMDALSRRDTEEAFGLLRSLLEERAPSCGVLMSASDIESAMFADSVWSLSRKGTLKMLSGPVEGDVIPFPGRGRGSSRSMGSA